MSRHRNVRSMNYSEEYEGFDDVYGHSMEDDYSISPSDAAQFMYDRTRQPQMSAFLDESDNIAEEDETGTEGQTYQRPALSDVDEIKLLSCLEEMHNVIGDSVPEHVLIDIVLKNNFDLSKSLDTVLSNSDTLLSRGTAHESEDAPKPQRERKENKERDDDFISSQNYLSTIANKTTIPNLKKNNEKLKLIEPDSKTLSNNLFSNIKHSKESNTLSKKSNLDKNAGTCSFSFNEIDKTCNTLETNPSMPNPHQESLVSHSIIKQPLSSLRKTFPNYILNPQSTSQSEIKTCNLSPSTTIFQTKFRKDSNKENEQEVFFKTLREDDSNESSSSEDNDFSSLTALAKQHQRIGSEGVSVSPVRGSLFSSIRQTFNNNLMDPSIGTIESGSNGKSLPNSFGDESSLGKQCIDTQYDSLADLISSHLEINKPSDSRKSPDMTRDGNFLAGIGHSLSEMRVDDKNIKLVIPTFGRSSLLRRERNPFSRYEDSSPDTTGNAVKGVASPVEAPSGFIIDLKSALKSTHSKSSPCVSLVKELTPVQLLDFNNEINDFSTKETQDLSCEISASQILTQNISIRQCSSSAFGKILLKKWTRLPTPYVCHKGKKNASIEPFDFDLLSPDDIILKSLLRNNKKQ